MESIHRAMECQECGKPLVGRRDKKFCDSDCRAAYHNRNTTLGEETIRQYNSILRHNRRILRTLCPQGKSTVRREVLEQMGYKFAFYTNVYQSGKGGIYYLCYDYGFTPIIEGAIEKALIIQRQEYMDRAEADLWLRL
jgi:hypothetical protein